MTWADVVPVGKEHVRLYRELPDPSPEETREMLSRLVVLKLNGGLGTTMGMLSPVSLTVLRREILIEYHRLLGPEERH